MRMAADDRQLTLLTRRRDVMGVHVNRPIVIAAASAVAALISALNVYLVASILL